MGGASTPSSRGVSPPVRARWTSRAWPRDVTKLLGDLDISPEPYADYRPIFETKRLNVTHVSIHPGETVPAHTHDDEDQIYWVQSGEGFVELDGKRTDVSAGSAVLIPLG